MPNFERQSAPPPEESSKKIELQKQLEKVEGQTRDLEILAPKVLGVGRENAVFSLEKTVKNDTTENFEVARHRGLVAKVDVRKMRDTIKEDVANKKQWEKLSDDEREVAMTKFAERRREKMMSDVEKAKERWAKVHDFFPEYTVPERYYIKPVPVNRELFAAATGKNEREARNIPLPDKLVAIPAVIRLQQRIPGEILQDPETMDLSMGYVETDDQVSAEDYDRYNQDLLEGGGATAAEYLQRLDKPDRKASMHELVEHLKTDKELRALVHDFASQAMEYTTQTGEILDIFGAGNVFIHKDRDKKWTMTFMDVIHPNEQLWDEGLKYIEDIPHKDRFTKEDAATAANVLGYVRDINALAALSGVEHRLRLPVSIRSKNKALLAGSRRRLGTNSVPPSDVTPLAPERRVAPPKTRESLPNDTMPVESENDADNRPNTEEIQRLDRIRAATRRDSLRKLLDNETILQEDLDNEPIEALDADDE